MTALRLWAALAMTFAVVVVSVRLLVLGSVALDGPTVALLVAVPAAQAIVVAALRRWRSGAS